MRNSRLLLQTVCAIFSFAVVCSAAEKKIKSDTAKGGTSMKITSSAFTEGGMIPKKYTCDDINISPPLQWSDAPAGAKSFALICDDPDAPMGTWVHWVAYNIPPKVNELPEKVPVDDTLSDGTLQGINDFRKTGYGGPCPPGGTHRYFFRLYALDTQLSVEKGVTKSKLVKAMEGHVLAETQVMGKYKR
ncbi:MAG: YbhB/YbcL family Raf kinase inhibitor-like protein [Chitinispirillaceae bacterium]|nr:YbhB/YbcL family Raf kinase inhibitor-like protein [Chitinispirillaceae bacterium]